MRRRRFLVGCLGCLLSLTLALGEVGNRSLKDGTPVRIVIDADTANEMDDLFAIVRAIREPGFQVEGICSAQWNHRLSPPNTVQLSQQLNEDIVRLMGRLDLPVPMGSEMIVGHPWGGTKPRESAATALIIRAARETPDGQRLLVVSLGANTNVASAIRLAPDIVTKIACYSIMGRYDAERRIWNKDEFNLRNDLNAANVLFNTEGLELHVMPANILSEFRFKRDETLKRLRGRGTIWDYLAARWLTHCASCEDRILWDLALIEAIVWPKRAQESECLTPPENHQRKVSVYTSIDHEFLMADWWNSLPGSMLEEDR